jgi:16S rRNA processing protein RimM
MNEYIYLGYITGCHGIKGELKLKSNFEFKSKVLNNGFKLYVGPLRKEVIISSYRPFKQFDLITVDNLFDINLVYQYVKNDVYIKKIDLKLNDNEYLLSDLIGLDVIEDDKCLGKIIDYDDTNKINILIEVKGDKTFCFPKNDHYIKSIDFSNKKIYTNGVGDLRL